jgi:hypothetical protein
MTRSASRNLFHWKAEPPQPVGIVLSLDIPGKNRNALAPRQGLQSAFQQAGFT